MKLLLVDDQNVVRKTRANALTAEEGIDLVIQAEGAREAVTLQQRHRFDVAVIELSLADRTGTELIRELKTFADTRVLVLSIRSDEFSVGEAMRAGADGYLSKRSHLRDLVDAIRTVARDRGDPSGPPLRQGGHAQRRRPHPARRALRPDRNVERDLVPGERHGDIGAHHPDTKAGVGAGGAGGKVGG